MNHRSAGAASVRTLIEDLEADIIFGRLRPNQELTEDALMERFAVKRHVVRSAIQELVSRRVVVKPPSRSARVKDFTLDEVREIYHMRELLQRDAALIMPLPAPPDALDALKATCDRHAAAVSAGMAGGLIHQLNDEFHSRLFALCSNRELCKAIAFYTEVSNPIRSYGIVDAAWLQRAVDEHEAMVLAIEQQDRTALARLVVDHMQPTRHRWEALHADRALSHAHVAD
jgi:DNA-binding GntR family transcriptional regulator